MSERQVVGHSEIEVYGRKCPECRKPIDPAYDVTAQYDDGTFEALGVQGRCASQRCGWSGQIK